MTVDEEASTARVEAFRAELRDDAPWVATVTPRLTWSVASGTPGWIQAWAEVRSAGEVVRIDGADSVLVPWPLSPLSPGEQTTVSVRVCSTEGAMTPWSEPLELTAVAGVEWVARPIALPEPDAVARPGRFRRAFDVDRPVRRALLHYTALGVVEMAVNGSAVDDTVLAPGWTSYRQRLTFETADVTALLSTGENLISARLGGGWWTEEYHVLTVPKRHYGAQPRLMAQLEIVYQDGGRDIVATDAGWAATPDPALTASGIYAGERFDARMFDDAWTQPGFDASAWPAASEAAEDLPVPTPRMSPPVRRIETRAVESVAQAPSGECSSTSARISSAACGSECGASAAPCCRSGMPRCSTRATWRCGRCAGPRPQTSTCSPATARRPGNLGSRSTDSVTPASRAGRVTSIRPTSRL
ncbi:hypothetical protein GCM10025863_27100 [Microbacterium suwonense]|uniref:Bacterial alpha-L-rhamnosidase N-terminal domain-containing protein n=1 Tax=Microbacterium suwonense TaxID=683047 RepID=A0ABM8FX21_9MICO|nr:hypothetical protein GCM10025863_27100 [Microbacterium suwonense]